MDATDPKERITVADLEAAINRARSQRPSSGAESSLAPEVDVLAGLYGRMIWLRRDSIALGELEPAEREAVVAWMASGAR